MRLGKSNLSAVEKITIVLMNLLHLPISALFHQDIILHIQAVYQWQVRSMHSLIRVWFLNPFRLPNSQYCGVTLVPPCSLKAFIDVIADNSELSELKKLLENALSNNKWVIHYGL
jgi:hypothetical protein